jgi:hypothetical protein
LKNRIEHQVEIQDRWFSFTRGLKTQPTGESHKFDYLVEHFVDEITGPYDQDVSLLLVGNKGRGKSLAAQSLCYYAGCELAERLGGKWQDYYDPAKNLAIILESEATAVMGIQEKYQCKNYDDIGIGWGARNWQDKDNKDKNDVFQINRTTTHPVFRPEPVPHGQGPLPLSAMARWTAVLCPWLTTIRCLSEPCSGSIYPAVSRSHRRMSCSGYRAPADPLTITRRTESDLQRTHGSMKTSTER